jgi:probable glucitol transport protein GutA
MIEAEQLVVTKSKDKNKSNSRASLSWLERIGYGLGDMSYNIVFQFVNAYLLFYYTDVGGIHPAVIATLFLVVRVLDAIFDPIMGVILDKTNTRWGRARPYGFHFLLHYSLSCVLPLHTLDQLETLSMHTLLIFYSACPLVCKRFQLTA